jgi:hypothetical protein
LLAPFPAVRPDLGVQAHLDYFWTQPNFVVGVVCSASKCAVEAAVQFGIWDSSAMGTYFAVFSNFMTSTQIGAHFDVAADTLAAPQGTPILFDVYDAEGQPLAQFETHTNNNGFASNATLTGPNRDLFRITNGRSGAVRVRTPDTAVQTGLLQQRGADARLLLGVSPLATSDGRQFALGKIFPVTVGNVSTAHLLVANPEGADLAVDVHVGTRGPTGGGKYSNPRITNHAHWRVDLAPTERNSGLIVVASDPVVVQLVVTDPGPYAISCLPVA